MTKNLIKTVLTLAVVATTGAALAQDNFPARGLRVPQFDNGGT
jgi:hypothetical protein